MRVRRESNFILLKLFVVLVLFFCKFTFAQETSTFVENLTLEETYAQGINQEILKDSSVVHSNSPQQQIYVSEGAFISGTALLNNTELVYVEAKLTSLDSKKKKTVQTQSKKSKTKVSFERKIPKEKIQFVHSNNEPFGFHVLLKPDSGFVLPSPTQQLLLLKFKFVVVSSLQKESKKIEICDFSLLQPINYSKRFLRGPPQWQFNKRQC